MTTLKGSILKEASSAWRAAGSSPVRSRCVPSSPSDRAVSRAQLQRLTDERDRFVEPVAARREVAGDAIDLAVVRRDREHLRDLGLEIGDLVLDVVEPRDRATCASRLDGLISSAFSSILRASSRLPLSIAWSARKTCARTSDGLISSALSAAALAVGGSSSASASAMPSIAGPYFGSTVERVLERLHRLADSGRSSRKSSPHAVLSAGSFGASETASRYVSLASLMSWTVPSARSARAARPSSDASVDRIAVDATRVRTRLGIGAAEHVEQQPELERGLARRRASGDRPEQRLGVLVPAARDQRARPHRGDIGVLLIELLDERRPLRRSAPR